MAETKVYKIHVGEVRPADALLGYLEKGNSIIKGTAVPAPPFGGFSIFPNRSKVWGARMIDGATPKVRVEPTDPNYKGKVKWLKWGDPEGYEITIRYKSSCSSIDYEYQITQLRMAEFSEDLEDNYMQLPFGENNFYFDSEAVRIEFLSVMHENDDSICKSPNAIGGQFHEVKLFDSTKQDVKKIDNRFESIRIIKESDSYEHLKTLKSILEKKVTIKEDPSNEGSLYENLVLYANDHPEDFMDCISDFNRRVSDVFEKCKAYKAIDITKNGTIVIGQTKREILFSNIPAKGEAMIDWMFKNAMKPEVFEAINRAIHLSNKFK